MTIIKSVRGREIFDSRRDEGAPGTNALHFELEMLPVEATASPIGPRA